MKLEIGQVIWGTYMRSLSKHVITRVTEKRAFAKINDFVELCFEREQRSDLGFFAIGTAGYAGATRTVYSIGTPELNAINDAIFRRKEKCLKIRQLDLTKLTEDQLDAMLAAAK